MLEITQAALALVFVAGVFCGFFFAERLSFMRHRRIAIDLEQMRLLVMRVIELQKADKDTP